MKIADIGMGNIGLLLAAQFADKGHEVVGVDVNADTVATINAREVSFAGEAQLHEHLARLVPTDHPRATTEYADGIPGVNAMVIVVPLFVDNDGTRDLATTLSTGTLIGYETTLPVGTARNRWKPMVEEISGLTEGADVHLAFSPERVLTGSVSEDLRYPKFIGALSKTGAERAREFYEAVLEFDERPDRSRANGVRDLGTAEASEMAKLAETTYRDGNIRLANQFALLAEKPASDLHQAIDACNLPPFSPTHRSGISVGGGQCFPVHPRLYLSNDPYPTVVQAARFPNATMLKMSWLAWPKPPRDLREPGLQSWGRPTAVKSRRPPSPASLISSVISKTRELESPCTTPVHRPRAEALGHLATRPWATHRRRGWWCTPTIPSTARSHLKTFSVFA